MKKRTRFIVLSLVLALLCGMFAFTAHSKDLEPCYHCESTGQFHCRVCNNQGEVTCHNCKGTGIWECPGEDGKGKCNNGYYTCPSCGGDGKNRTGDGKIIEGVCGNCNGAGKNECWTCHGTPKRACDGCGGTGKEECQASNCKAAKAIGWKCPFCCGAGYLLTNFWPGENDGVQNRPVNGDKIWVNGKSTTYGGGTPVQTSQTSGNNDETRDPNTGRDYIWFIDVGSGKWEIEGQSIVVKRNGSPVSGIVDLKYNEPIEISGITDSETRVFITGEGGFKAELELAGSEVCVGRRSPASPKAPYNLSLSIEYVGSDKAQNPTVPEQQDDEGGFPPADMTILPENRNSDFDITVSDETGKNVSASLRVETGKMTDEEQLYFAGLANEELAQILTNVRSIVATAEPGRSDLQTDELLNALAAQNGYETLTDGRLFPLYFEGHQEIGFPVRVTVSVEKGILDGGTDLFVYHVTDNAEVEPLGRAEYTTYEDGSIESISFYTSSFSTFFTAAKELDFDINIGEDDAELTDENEGQTENGTSIVPIIVGAAVVVVIIVVAVFLAIRKKSKKNT